MSPPHHRLPWSAASANERIFNTSFFCDNMRLKSPLPLPSSQKSRRPHKCPTSYLLQIHLVNPLSRSRPGFSQQVVRLLTAFDKLQRLWMTFFCEFTKSYHSKRLDF